MPLFLNALKQRGQLDAVQITIACVGSRKLGDRDDLGTSWQIFAPNLTVYGFDADADACEAANRNLAARQVPWTEVHAPLALADQVGESTLYVTRHPMCSSLFPPDENFLSRFAGLQELAGLDFTVEMETTTLDAFCQQEQVSGIDFLQMDVQGAELKVLAGAEALLPGVLGLQSEVSFSALYQNQPLFADVDAYLRQRQFEFFNFEFRGSPGVRRRSPIQSKTRGGQLLWSDAIYLKALPGLDVDASAANLDRLFKLACIADALDFSDYALDLLVTLTLQSDRNYADSILQGLMTIPDLVSFGLAKLPVVQQIQGQLSDEVKASLG
ncbi:MAG: FkbM family methyltransferase [Elainellaceae cyanobacterium]